MWDPGFAYSDVFSARVLGWHRRFTLISHESWGTKTAPGLCAVLHRGGSCWGRAFLVEPDQAEAIFQALDARENAYRRAKIQLEFNNGGTLHRRAALSYVADPKSPRLCADISPDTQLTYLRQGVGSKGSSRFYMQNTLRCLDEDGHFDTDTRQLFAMLNAFCGESDTL